MMANKLPKTLITNTNQINTMKVLHDVKETFNETVKNAFDTARAELEESLVGREVALEYAIRAESENPSVNGPRAAYVTGTVKSVAVGMLDNQAASLTTFVEFENGDEWVDAEEIVLKESFIETS